MKTLNQTGLQLAAAVGAVSSKASVEADEASKIHVIGAGRALTSAYEQLRNAAEYTEDHLLLQRAIRRFYRRLFLAPSQADIESSGEELVTELTLAGYLPNDSVAKSTANELSSLASDYYYAYKQIDRLAGGRLDAWTLDVLAVEVEARLSSPQLRDVFVQFAFDYFLETFDPSGIFKNGKSADYELTLYAAVHRSLLKSDEATIRWAILTRFQQSPLRVDPYVITNQKVDELLNSKLFDKLVKSVSRHGAAMRVLWRMFTDGQYVDQLIKTPNKFLPAYEAKIISEYEEINARIIRGILKCVIFLIITKFIIGIAIEVPYDYWR